MAKFRRAHRIRSGKMFPGFSRILLVIGFLLILFLFSRPYVKSLTTKLYDGGADSHEELYYLPTTANSFPIFHRDGYTLAYNEEMEQAAWVAYELTIDHLNASKVPRTNYFTEDLAIPTGSATFIDYKNSGYTKGHLVPAADRAYSVATMEETFLMSNISPQTYKCNAGIWRELEEQTRDWARSNQALYVLCGPIFPVDGWHHIGRNQVGVPESFFKVLLDATDPELKGIAFIIPNKISIRPLREYIVTIDEVEQKTGIDFFSELFTDKLEDSLESQIQYSAWPIDEKRFQIRINDWNKR